MCDQMGTAVYLMIDTTAGGNTVTATAVPPSRFGAQAPGGGGDANANASATGAGPAAGTPGLYGAGNSATVTSPGAGHKLYAHEKER